MIINLDEDDLKGGVLGLVVAIVEVVKDALRLQALRRMESGGLSSVEVERLGNALMDLDGAIERIKVEMGVTESVKAVRDGLDNLVGRAVDNILNPGRWQATEVGSGHEAA